MACGHDPRVSIGAMKRKTSVALSEPSLRKGRRRRKKGVKGGGVKLSINSDLSSSERKAWSLWRASERGDR